jgi:hypothetical protein
MKYCALKALLTSFHQRYCVNSQILTRLITDNFFHPLLSVSEVMKPVLQHQYWESGRKEQGAIFLIFLHQLSIQVELGR